MFRAKEKIRELQDTLGIKNILMLQRASLVAQGLRIYLQGRRPGFDPWVGKIPRRREWLLTPVFLPGEFHGQRCLEDCM